MNAIGETAFTVFGVLILAMSAGRAAAGQAPEPLGLVINEDNSHFYFTRKPDDLNLDGLNAFVDQYADTQVTHFFLCPNAMRTSYKSAVWDAIWELGSQAMPGGSAKAWFDNARILHERGLDPYAVWIARCREKGISPWLSMRMNDVHDVSNTTSFMHSTFWVDHPDYWRVPGSTGSWVDRAFDYGIPEVREHHMRLVRELLERYDADGLELDWMRFGYHFKPGAEKEGCAILTDFMRQARALTQEWAAKRGHPIKLGARVPAHPDAAAGLGMDAVTWVQEGLVDMLVPTPFWTTSDFDIPMELWRERLGDGADGIVLAAGLEYNLRAYPSAATTPNDLASMRGFAAASLHRGADQIYLFNHMDPGPDPDASPDYRTLVEEGLGMEVATGAPRRHVVTFHDTVPPGMSNGVALPADPQQGASFHIYVGPAPEPGGRALFVAGLAKKDGVADVALEVLVNGTACTPIADGENPGQYPGVVRAVRFECPLEAMKDGYNDAAVTQASGPAGQGIVWAEFEIHPAP
ncbi:MAG: family 10 glycosylhydrolase [Candidatus Hydrogenedentes bacterium]|nr:family 10 glycosylhydrolase [Candidatus Hydrogenedentota bacterium]